MMRLSGKGLRCFSISDIFRRVSGIRGVDFFLFRSVFFILRSMCSIFSGLGRSS